MQGHLDFFEPFPGHGTDAMDTISDPLIGIDYFINFTSVSQQIDLGDANQRRQLGGFRRNQISVKQMPFWRWAGGRKNRHDLVGVRDDNLLENALAGGGGGT